jgi:hypothetical protein
MNDPAQGEVGREKRTRVGAWMVASTSTVQQQALWDKLAIGSCETDFRTDDWDATPGVLCLADQIIHVNREEKGEGWRGGWVWR